VRDGARIAAAIGVLDDIETRHKPVRLALKAWGDGARYAGAKDRAFVSGLVLDALRRRRSLAWRMGDDGWRASVLGVLGLVWGWPADRIAEAVAETPHGPGALSTAEADALARPRSLDSAPPAVRGDYPDWLDELLERAFGPSRCAESQALAERAPADLRVNALKSDPARTIAALDVFGVAPSGVLKDALRVPTPAAAERAAAVESAPEFAKGWFEVQDLGSQIAAAAAGDVRGKQVLDLCAGGGGKALALAAAMGNSGQLYAFDAEARRLSDTVRRSQRAGVRNLQIKSPLKAGALSDLERRMDVVFVDAPCTGSGTWRRHPDAKWRLTPAQLARRIVEQDAVLQQAAAYVRPGGRLVYATCSVLCEENEDRIATFLGLHPDFHPAPVAKAIEASGQLEPSGRDMLAARATPEGFLRLSPASAGCDGFFVAVLERAA
jgi:16S rRNA (cytosine967-C5)-methyltransferase